MIVDLPLSSDDSELLALMVDFAARRVRPDAARADAEQALGSTMLTDLDELGLLTDIAEEHGGQGAPSAGLRLVLLEALAAADSGLALEAAAHAAALSLVQAVAPGETARRLVEPLLASGARATLAYHEGHGRSPLELETTAARRPDAWVLSGAKRTVVRPAKAELTVVVAARAGEPAAFALTGHPDRWRVTRDDQEVGKLGLRSAITGEVAFDELAAEVLGTGLELHRWVAWYRLAVGAIAVGVGAAALDYAVRYAKQRAAFGRQIIDYQGVEFPLVEADMALDAARLEIQDTWSTVAGEASPEAIAARVARAVALATSAGLDSARTGVNTLGGHGYLADHPQERHYRDATTLAAIDFDPLVNAGVGY